MNTKTSKAEVVEAGKRFLKKINRRFLEEIKVRIAVRERAVRDALTK